VSVGSDPVSSAPVLRVHQPQTLHASHAGKLATPWLDSERWGGGYSKENNYCCCKCCRIRSTCWNTFLYSAIHFHLRLTYASLASLRCLYDTVSKSFSPLFYRRRCVWLNHSRHCSRRQLGLFLGHDIKQCNVYTCTEQGCQESIGRWLHTNAVGIASIACLIFVIQVFTISWLILYSVWHCSSYQLGRTSNKSLLVIRPSGVLLPWANGFPSFSPFHLSFFSLTSSHPFSIPFHCGLM